MSLRDMLAKVADWMSDPGQDRTPLQAGTAPRPTIGAEEDVSVQSFYVRPVVAADAGYVSKLETASERNGQVHYSVESMFPVTSFGEQAKQDEVSRCTAVGCGKWDKTSVMVRCAMPGCARLLCKASQFPLIEPQGKTIYCPDCYREASKRVNTWEDADRRRSAGE